MRKENSERGGGRKQREIEGKRDKLERKVREGKKKRGERWGVGGKLEGEGNVERGGKRERR